MLASGPHSGGRTTAISGDAWEVRTPYRTPFAKARWGVVQFGSTNLVRIPKDHRKVPCIATPALPRDCHAAREAMSGENMIGEWQEPALFAEVRTVHQGRRVPYHEGCHP